MYISTHHITIRFNGTLNYYFAFDIRHTEAESWDCTIPNADIERIFKVKEDGYLYIQGCRITNNKDGIRTVYSCVAGGGDDCYRDYNLAIDNNGYVIVANRNITNNQISRTITKLFGK